MSHGTARLIDILPLAWQRAKREHLVINVYGDEEQGYYFDYRPGVPPVVSITPTGLVQIQHYTTLERLLGLRFS